MCLLAIQYRLVPEAPILVAANREEFYDRKSQPPSIQSGKPRILSGTDLQAGGTWLGVNQNGLFVGATNRMKMSPPVAPRSRGVLCRELLRASSAQNAMELAMEELSTGAYDGVNYSRDERVALARRLLTLQTLDSPVKFLAVASKVFARAPVAPDRPSMIIRGQMRGTVSSTLVSLGQKPRDAIFQYADGSPDEAKYEDYSPMLRDILSRGLREARTKANA